MTAQDAKALINEIRKAKYTPTAWEKNFLETISMNLFTFGRQDIFPKQGKVLQEIYRKAQENDACSTPLIPKPLR